MAQIPIATGFYEDAARPISRQECTNWIPQVPQTNAQSEAQLIHTPGITEFADTGQDAARGEHEVAGTAFTVNGNDLFRINEDGTTDNLGVISGAGAVSIADNGVQMCIVVPGGLAYIYTATGGLVTITDTDFTLTLGPSQQVVYIDGYFIHFNNDAPASSQPIFFNSAVVRRCFLASSDLKCFSRRSLRAFHFLFSGQSGFIGCVFGYFLSATFSARSSHQTYSA